jgi:formamidopyrimidine-DNA glycosylase
MPELPEVETTLRGVLPHLLGRVITSVEVREPRLRWPVPEAMQELSGQRIVAGSRRAKYLLFKAESGTLLVHLGMSGSLRLTEPGVLPRKHDHVSLHLDSGMELRYHDPRRFGAMLWLTGVPEEHDLLRHLGPEPFDEAFSVARLTQLSRGKSAAVKLFIMDGKTAVGIGNIYACEALFMAGINPTKAAGKVKKADYERLVVAVREVLLKSIEMGGTTLRDFVREDGQPGYFKQSLRVYGREGEPCLVCARPVRRIVQGQRSTFYCPHCQR